MAQSYTPAPRAKKRRKATKKIYFLGGYQA